MTTEKSLYDTHVFLGPTLDRNVAASYLPHAHYHSPIQCGDLIRLLRLKPKWVVIIDGLYENVPAVWHKEILLAMDRGIHVVGAASMGALRAAELHAYGMIGVGTIFQDFLHQQLNDDDEVAVLHQGKADNFVTINEAMVNIRTTLKSAVENNLIDTVYQTRLLNACKAQFYPYRSLFKVIQAVVPPEDLTRERLMKWLLKKGVVDVKQQDAIAALQFVQQATQREVVRAQFPPMPVSKFIASLLDESLLEPFPEPSTLSRIEKELADFAQAQPRSFGLVKNLGLLLKNIYALDDLPEAEAAEKYLFFIEELSRGAPDAQCAAQNVLYHPESDFLFLKKHPHLSPLYAFICEKIYTYRLSPRFIDRYQLAAALYYDLELQALSSFDQKALRLNTVLLILLHAAIEDERLQLKQEVILAHLKDIQFWRRHEKYKELVPLPIAIEFVSMVMKVTFLHQGFRDVQANAAKTPHYFDWLYDSYHLLIG